LTRPPLLAERWGLAEPRLDGRGPLAARIGVEASLDPPRKDQSLGKRLTELGRKREAVLVIDRVLVLAYQHGPLRTTLDHYSPLSNPFPPHLTTRRASAFQQKMQSVRIPPFETFYDEHKEPVFAHLRRLLGDGAEDAFQETFLRALRAYPRLKDGRHLRAWV